MAAKKLTPPTRILWTHGTVNDNLPGYTGHVRLGSNRLSRDVYFNLYRNSDLPAWSLFFVGYYVGGFPTADDAKRAAAYWLKATQCRRISCENLSCEIHNDCRENSFLGRACLRWMLVKRFRMES